MATITTTECTELQAAVLAYRELLDSVNDTWRMFIATYKDRYTSEDERVAHQPGRAAWLGLLKDLCAARERIIVLSLGGRSESPT